MPIEESGGGVASAVSNATGGAATGTTTAAPSGGAPAVAPASGVPAAGQGGQQGQAASAGGGMRDPGATPAPAVGAPVTAGPSQRELLSQALGIDLRNFATDEAALSALRSTWQQQAAHAQQFQQVLPHWSQYQSWLKQQQQQAAAAQGQKKSWWVAPEWNEGWMQQVEMVDGQYRALPGADPTIPQKIREYHQFQREMLHKLAANPIEAIKPGLEEMLEERVKSMLDARLGQQESHQFAVSQAEKNAGWLYEKDAQGGVARNPVTGERVFTMAGTVFMGFVKQLEGMGAKDPKQVWSVAEQMTRGYLLEAANKAQGVQPAAAVPGAAAVVPAPVAAGVNRLQGMNLQAAQGGGAAVPRRSLGDMLRGEFARNGITDADF